MLQPDVAVPQLHRTILAPAFSDRDGRAVVRRLELAEMVDVAAEAVHEIEAVITHAPTPPGAEACVYHLVSGVATGSDQGRRPVKYPRNE